MSIQSKFIRLECKGWISSSLHLSVHGGRIIELNQGNIFMDFVKSRPYTRSKLNNVQDEATVPNHPENLKEEIWRLSSKIRSKLKSVPSYSVWRYLNYFWRQIRDAHRFFLWKVPHFLPFPDSQVFFLKALKNYSSTAQSDISYHPTKNSQVYF